MNTVNVNGPIGENFNFLGIDLVIDAVKIYDDVLNGRGDVHIDAHTVNGASITPAVKNTDNPFGIDHVIFNGPATIVFWLDGSKTVVKCADDEIYNERTAIMWAIMKKVYGNSSRVNKALDNIINDSRCLGIDDDSYSLSNHIDEFNKIVSNLFKK